MAYHSERVIHHPALTLKYLRPSRHPSLRVVVGVKVSPKATQRNLLKRRLREIWRVIPIPSDVAVTLYTTKATLGLSFAELKRAVVQLAHQLTKE
jgi:ribonuclease P protein component